MEHKLIEESKWDFTDELDNLVKLNWKPVWSTYRSFRVPGAEPEEYISLVLERDLAQATLD